LFRSGMDMNRPNTLTLVVIVAVFALLGVLAGRYGAPLLKDMLRADDTARVAQTQEKTLPAFTLYDLDGNEVTRETLLASNKALFINFWATWCKPCREEMPLLSQLQERYADDLLMVGVAIDNADAVRAFLDHIGGVSYPIALGRQELDAIEVANAMGSDLVGLPVSITADRNGRIVEVHVGEVDELEATALIEAVL